MENINFTVEQGKTEVWTITNQTMMAHPFHLHGNSFWVVSVNGSAPSANMKGRKDVITVPPMNGSVKIVVRYEDFSDPYMPYMYHCHILSHEDNGMMGQFIVKAPASGTIENAEKSLRFYPNPAGETVFFELNNNLSESAFCKVRDMTGQLVLQQNLLVLKGHGSIILGKLPTGSYSVQILSAGKTYSSIFIKK